MCSRSSLIIISESIASIMILLIKNAIISEIGKFSFTDIYNFAMCHGEKYQFIIFY